MARNLRPLTGGVPVGYIPGMASLQAYTSGRQKYWRIVESRRVNGKPRPIPVLYLGRADNLLARLREAPELKVASRSHGAVAALWSIASELGVASIIDRHLRASGRRASRKGATSESVGEPPHMTDGLTVGQSLALVAIGRACRATSKRGFAKWANETTLGELAGADTDRLDSQHFWEQMDQLPVANIANIERDILLEVTKQYPITLRTLLYDGTNFFTFIASTNERASLPERGHNKQKRNDLRQVSVAMLCTQEAGIPVWHQTYAGALPDASEFEQALPLIKQRVEELQGKVKDVTIVFDKGNVSRANQSRVDDSKLHYVTGLTVASQKKLVATANRHMTSVQVDDDENVMAYRTRRKIWGKSRTAVVMISERLKQGQIQGILQHAATAQEWLSNLSDTLKRGRQRRSRKELEVAIQNRLKGRQHLRDVIEYKLSGEDPKLELTYTFNQDALDRLASETLGRLVLITDRHQWTTAEIIGSYRSQAVVAALFEPLKDHVHVALRPQFHWTDQKIQIHVFTCTLAHLLECLLFMKAQSTTLPYRSQEALLDALAGVRRATVIQSTGARRKPRVTRQLEEVDSTLAPHLAHLGIAS